jgi:small conductance mechanosensitive channel
MADIINRIASTYGLKIVLILVGILIIAIILAVLKHLLKKSNVDPMMHKFIYNAVKVALILVLVVMGLNSFGIDTTSIITVLGVGGAAIALALKDSLSNIAGGVIIAFTKPFSKDDYIEVDGKLGLVEEIDLLSTSLRTYDNKIISFPNGVLSKSVIINHTKENLRRVDLVFGIGYESDVDKAREILLEMAENYPLILTEPEPFTGIKENSASAVELEYRVWCKTEDFWTVKYHLMENVKKRFDEAGIEIPYKQIDVNLKNKGNI